jgi:hypothetical protein
MKTSPILEASAASSLSIPLPPPPPVTSKRRPARRGTFWPGESFGDCTNRWDLSGVFVNDAFVLPTLVGSRGPQMV